MCIYNRVNFPHVYFSGFQHCSRSHRTPFAVANSAAQCGSVFAAASSLWPRHDGCWSRDQDGHHFGESCGGGVLKHGFCWENQREICGNPWVCDLSKKMVSGRFANQFSDELFFFPRKNHKLGMDMDAARFEWAKIRISWNWLGFRKQQRGFQSIYPPVSWNIAGKSPNKRNI